MSWRKINDPLTPERLAHIALQIKLAHGLGGPAYADCKGILGLPMEPRGSTTKVQPKKPRPVAKPTPVEVRREERRKWWQAMQARG